VAYKTGTSYGFRDAWAIGYDTAYTVGIWVGRPDGTFSPGRMGRDAAAPVLFDVFDMLPRPQSVPSVVFAAKPPAGVLQASNADLPPPLRRFDPGPSALDALFAAGDRPQIAYPADRATVALSAGDGRIEPLLLRANGGRMPLLWLVNGVPVASAPFKRQAQYRPDGAGATRITVIDSAGASASVEVWIQ
jgi:penicillin-binding protein 1C